MILPSMNLEMPDLTHARTVELFRQWNGDPAYLHLLRFIRVSSTDLASISIVRYGLQERGKPSAINQSDPMDASSTGGDTNGTFRAIAMDTAQSRMPSDGARSSPDSPIYRRPDSPVQCPPWIHRPSTEVSFSDGFLYSCHIGTLGRPIVLRDLV